MKKAIKASIKTAIPVKFQPRLRDIYARVIYFGVMYQCPFCHSHLRRFLPRGLKFSVLKEKEIIGGGYRENAICPVCGSVDRERLLYLYLLHKTDIFEKPKKLLHVAPEAKLAIELQSKDTIDYLSADISSKYVMVKMDITAIQYPDNSFDVIICNHVLEHIIDDGKAMSELYRTLKPGGWAILQVPISFKLKNTYEDFSITTENGREAAFGQGDHVRIYGEDYQDRLTQAGFIVNVFKWITKTENFGGRRNTFGLNEEERVYVVSK